MIHYSDKEDRLTKGTVYFLDGQIMVYLGRMSCDGAKSVQYRFRRPTGENSYRTLTAHELDNSELLPRRTYSEE